MEHSVRTELTNYDPVLILTLCEASYETKYNLDLAQGQKYATPSEDLTHY